MNIHYSLYCSRLHIWVLATVARNTQRNTFAGDRYLDEWASFYNTERLTVNLCQWRVWGVPRSLDNKYPFLYRLRKRAGVFSHNKGLFFPTYPTFHTVPLVGHWFWPVVPFHPYSCVIFIYSWMVIHHMHKRFPAGCYATNNIQNNQSFWHCRHFTSEKWYFLRWQAMLVFNSLLIYNWSFEI